MKAAMDHLGRLHGRYYVIKTSGIFSKSSKILEIYDEGIVFVNPSVSKATKGKDREAYYYRDDVEAGVSERNEKDLQMRMGKQSFSVGCSERRHLLTDLLHY